MRTSREAFFRRYRSGNGYNRPFGPRSYRNLFFRWSRRMRNRNDLLYCQNCYQRANIIRLLPTVWNLRQNDLFCDAFIETSDKKCYKVHRVILAASSEYFRAIFTNPLSASSCQIRLDFTSDIVESFIEYCYSGTCRITTRNVEALLPAADQIGIVGLVQLCCSFLKSHINSTNCWGIHLFCKTYFCEAVALEARRYAVNHFLDFFREKNEFLSITVDDLIGLLSDDNLNIRKEEQVFIAADQWIRQDIDKRSKHASKLMMCIRCNFMDKSFFLETVVKATFIKQVDPHVLEIMTKAAACTLALRTDSRTEEVDIIGSAPPFLPRIPYEIVFAVGGWTSGIPTNHIETFDIRANHWFVCKERDLVRRSYHGLVCINNLIYMIGGFDGNTHFNTVRCFDPVLGGWTEKACMYHARCYVSCVVLNGHIYAIGGYNGRIRMKSVEKYNIFLNQWEEISPMNKARSDAGATVCNNRIYVAGGFSGQDVLSSAEVYDPTSDMWTLIADMSTPRSGVSLIHYKGYVYAIGGFNGAHRLKTMERYHSYRSYNWDQHLPEMITQRSNFSCTILEDMILVVGGFDGNSTIGLTEYYDGRGWNSLSSMEVNRSALAICTVSGLPNASAYSLVGKIKRKFVNDPYKNR